MGEAGEVTGAGSGEKGSNVDLFINDQVPREKVLKILRDTLARVGVVSAKLVFDGTAYPFP